MCVVSVLITSYRSASVQKESELPNKETVHFPNLELHLTSMALQR